MPLLDVSINATRILHAVWSNAGISRIDLSRELNLNKSTITKIVNSLLEEGLLILADQSYVIQGKGRRPTGLFINPELGVILGIEIRTDSWNAVAVNPVGEVIDRYTGRPIEPGSELENVLWEAIEECSRSQQDLGRRVLGLGVGLSGQINPYEGVIISSNPLNIREPLDIHERLEHRLEFPMVIENDANCCCLNVIMQKRTKHDRNFLCVLGEFRRTGMGKSENQSDIEGLGLGLGLVIKDSVLHGDNFTAGEFQSIFKNPDNPNPTQLGITAEEVSRLHTDMDVWKKAMRELSGNLALLVNTLNITHVRFFGDFLLDAGYLLDQLAEAIQSNWTYDSPISCSIDFSDDATHAVATGAAAYFLNRLYSVPDVHEEYSGSYPYGIELLRMTLEDA